MGVNIFVKPPIILAYLWKIRAEWAKTPQLEINELGECAQEPICFWFLGGVDVLIFPSNHA